LGISQTSLVRGDGLCMSIAAASVLAKTTRDALMRELDVRIPGYGLAQHKGYGTRAHRAALSRIGRSPIHRKTFSMGT
jgi:ribonuclease HII